MAVMVQTKKSRAGAASLKEDAMRALRVNVVVHRAHKRLSQVQLAEKAGVSRPVISKMEQGLGSPSFESLAKIAAVFGCSVADLFEPVDMRPVSDEEIRRRMAEGISDDDIDANFLLNAIDEANQAATYVTRYSPRGRKPAMAHHRKKRRS